MVLRHGNLLTKHFPKKKKKKLSSITLTQDQSRDVAKCALCSFNNSRVDARLLTPSPLEKKKKKDHWNEGITH